MSRNRYGGYGEDPYTNGNGNGGYGSPIRETDDYDPYGNDYGDRYGTPPIPTNSPPATRNQYSRPRRAPESKAEKEIGVVLEHIKSDWPAMCQNECLPVHVALQLLDTSSVGRAHEYR